MARRRRKQKGGDPVMAGLFIFGFAVYALVASPALRPLAILILLSGVVAAVVYVRGLGARRQRALALRELGTLSPREFELHVAQVLAALPGWSARATRSAGDQGADVIAQGPDGIKLAVQVKHYRQAVGNKAVQEIVASKAVYGCTHAVVVTSGPGYTRAAQELARANGVPLWDATILFRLQECAAQRRPVPWELLAG